MNAIVSIPNDDPNINVKAFLLDPLSVIIKLAILGNKPHGTKLHINNNIIAFQEPGYFQAISRMLNKSNKTDLQYIFNPIYIACSTFLNETIVSKQPRLKKLFECAQLGIKKLIDTYKNCSILVITLSYYQVLITNYLKETFNDTMYIKDPFSNYYTEKVTTELNSQWTDEKIKVVLDLITFILKSNAGTHTSGNVENVKSLENIMTAVDANTQCIINSIF